jgi:two-component system, NtrC family, nitrogen regulation sensor histidine kinase NtrY
MNGALPRERTALSGAGVRYVLILCVSLGAIALFLLATASANTALFAEQFPLLVVLNGAVAVILTGLVAYQLMLLRRKRDAGEFGSKLTTRLVILFALMAILPGVLMYGVSAQFLARSIDSWFQVGVDRALEGGLNLARAPLETMLKDEARNAATMAQTLSGRQASEPVAALSSVRAEAGVEQAAVFSEAGKLIAYSGDEGAGVTPEPPSPAALRQMRADGWYGAIEAGTEKGLHLRVMVPLPAMPGAGEELVLLVVRAVPAQLARDAEAVQAGYRQYQELTLSRRGLKRLYGVTLTLTLLLAVLSAAALAFVLSDRLSAPLGALVAVTRAVASGDFSQRAAVVSRDEIGMLTQSFNSMTMQLAEARAQAERHQAALVQAKAYLESVLANLSAGVLVFDEELNLRAANYSAGAIFGIDFAPLLGIAAERWPESAPGLAQLGREIAGAFQRAARSEWEQQVERPLRGRTQLLLLRGTRLPQGTEGGRVVVFDDITHLAEAQRAAAWAEVARRLAHEIRNPLTPIQLSAERLQVKLEGKLAAPDAEMLARSIQTIVNQVAALKHMVDAFSQYARTPEPSMRELDLNALTREVLTLYEGSLGASLQMELAAGLPTIVGDAAQLRQVIHNLMQNAQDALAETRGPCVTVATGSAEGMVRLTVTDNGAGFSEHVLKRAFEPYVTTKPRGSGLGLVVVKKIVEEHGGTVTIANMEPRGAHVTILLPAPAPDVARRTVARAQV